MVKTPTTAAAASRTFLMACCLACILILFPLNATAHEAQTKTSEHCARYLGNAGVMITRDETKILFDAFYSESYGQYALVPEATRDAMMRGQAPFDAVDALFISHVHGDHFSPAPTMAYLKANPEVALYASTQVITALGEMDEAMRQRVHAIALEAGDAAQHLEVDAMTIAVVRIPHAGGERTADVQNLAFRVTLPGEYSVLHLGDADPDQQLFAPHQAHWDARVLNLALPPYWFFASREGPQILSDQLKAQRSIGVHVPVKAAGHGDQWSDELGADVFTDPGEVRVLGGGRCLDGETDHHADGKG